MLQISRRADYAVRTILELSRLPGDTHISAGDLAVRTQVPKSFLHKIVADLVKAGLVLTYKGPSGGLALARPARTINVLHVIEAVDGPMCLNACLLRPRECPRDAICPAHTFWGRLQQTVLAEMQAATFDGLAQKADDLADQPRLIPLEIPYVLQHDWT